MSDMSTEDKKTAVVAGATAVVASATAKTSEAVAVGLMNTNHSSNIVPRLAGLCLPLPALHPQPVVADGRDGSARKPLRNLAPLVAVPCHGLDDDVHILCNRPASHKTISCEARSEPESYWRHKIGCLIAAKLSTQLSASLTISIPSRTSGHRSTFAL